MNFLNPPTVPKYIYLDLNIRYQSLVTTFFKLYTARIWILFTEKRSDISDTNQQFLKSCRLIHIHN